MQMQEVDVVYLYEHAARELDVACAIVAILEREHRLAVKVVHWPAGFSRVEHHIRPRLVVLPYCYGEENYTFLLAKWRNSIFFNASWEQLFYLGNLISKTPHGRFAIEHVIHHSWSTHYAGFLREQGIREDRILLNGQPSYTLYNEPYRRYFTSRSDLAIRYGLDSGCKWILFPENYNWAFYTDVKLAYFIEQGQSSEDVHIMRDFCERSLTETVRWCARLAAREDVEIIIRPRPSTSMQDFLRSVGEILPDPPQHLHIIQEGSVREWILASDVVVSSYSTTLIEAAVAGKSVYMLEPYPIPESLRVGWHDYLPHLKMYEEFLAKCTKTTGLDSSLGPWARKTLMSKGDSIHRMADFIAQLVQGTMESPPAPSWETVVPDPGYRRYIQLRKHYRKIRHLLRIPKIEPVPPEYSKDVKSIEETTDKIGKWMDILYASARN